MRSTMIRVTLALHLLLAHADAQEVSFEEHLIASVPEGVILEGEPIIGPDDKQWPNTMPVVWAPDGTQVAYVGLVDGKSHPVVGVEVGDEYDYASTPVFGASGAETAFRVGNRTREDTEDWWALVNGERIGRTDWMGAIAFSPDGERLAWWTRPGAKSEREVLYGNGDQMLVLATRKKDKWRLQESEEWKDSISLEAPCFDDKGRAIAGARKHGLWYVISFDGRKEKELCSGMEWLRDFAVSPKGGDIAAVAWDYDGFTGSSGRMPGTLVHVDKKRYGKNYHAAAKPVFSPDGRHIAYEVQRNGICGTGFDGEEDAETSFDSVSKAVFSPDGKRIAFVGREGTGSGDDPRPIGEDVDGKQRATIVLRDAKKDARIETGAAFVAIRDLTFGPGGEQIAFRALDADGWRMIVGDATSEPFDELGPPHFSDDGARVAFGARKGRELWWKVLELESDGR